MEHNKTNKKTCSSGKDTDQPGHLPSLISLHCLPEEGSLPTHEVCSEVLNQTRKMPDQSEYTLFIQNTLLVL